VKRAVFLDRDGVLNPMSRRAGAYRAPLTLDDFTLYPWAADAVTRLREAGFVCLVATNQPEMARGELSPATLDAMHRRLTAELRVDAVYVCPHVDEDGCACRKPSPGLLRAAAQEWNVDLAASFVVGDRWRDVEAGRAAGCVTILVDGPTPGDARPHHRARDLRDAVSMILTLAGSVR
jgi:D-glycero-D-manno-heptose 1,7-bisphosphate phosphatase